MVKRVNAQNGSDFIEKVPNFPNESKTNNPTRNNCLNDHLTRLDYSANQKVTFAYVLHLNPMQMSICALFTK